jgi:glycosyltransferase involved in cell wall biosynthesis
MKFLILMPVLNGEKYISEAIQSLRAQSYSNWQLIVLDGCSTDDSVDIASKFAEIDDRIVIRSETDNGMYDALIRGFCTFDGDVFSWLNADDLYPPWALATVAQHLSDASIQWAVGLPSLWDDAGRQRAVVSSSYYPRNLVMDGWFHDQLLGCIQQESVFFRSELFNSLTADERILIASQRMAGDFLLWKLFAERTELHAISAVVGGFRLHKTNLSRQGGTAYHDEVVGCGGKVLPRWLSRRIGSLFRLISALKTHNLQGSSVAKWNSQL